MLVDLSAEVHETGFVDFGINMYVEDVHLRPVVNNLQNSETAADKIDHGK